MLRSTKIVLLVWTALIVFVYFYPPSLSEEELIDGIQRVRIKNFWTREKEYLYEGRWRSPREVAILLYGEDKLIK